MSEMIKIQAWKTPPGIAEARTLVCEVIHVFGGGAVLGSGTFQALSWPLKRE